MVPFPAGTQPDNELCFQTRERVPSITLHILTGAGCISLSHYQGVILILLSVHVRFSSTSCRWARRQHPSFPCLLLSSSLTISEAITHILAFSHFRANKPVTYNFPAGALWTNEFQNVNNVFLYVTTHSYTLVQQMNDKLFLTWRKLSWKHYQNQLTDTNLPKTSAAEKMFW